MICPLWELAPKAIGIGCMFCWYDCASEVWTTIAIDIRCENEKY